MVMSDKKEGTKLKFCICKGKGNETKELRDRFVGLDNHPRRISMAFKVH